jgi:hypothetical protein
MNTNEASLGQSTVQTYSTTEKSDFDRAVFALECTARWLDNGSDPAQAAEQIRLAIAQIKGCIADCDVHPADACQPTAIDKKQAVYREVGVWQPNGSKFMTYAKEDLNGKAMFVLESEPAAPSVEQDERVAWPTLASLHLEAVIFAYNEGWQKAYDGREFANPFAPSGSQAAAWELGTRDGKERREIHTRAASTSANVAQGAEAVRTYTTKAGEAVAGVALRQCGNESEWRHILACNPKFADLLPSDYFPAGTVLTLPPEGK